MVAVAVVVYGVAAALDVRQRRVPNVLWAIGLVACLVTTVTVLSVVSGIVVTGATAVVWLRGGLGAADVKALGLLPLALPVTWPLAIVGAAIGTVVGFVAGRRDELPFCLPLFAGVVLAVASRPYLYN